jgi:hypothetical protein
MVETSQLILQRASMTAASQLIAQRASGVVESSEFILQRSTILEPLHLLVQATWKSSCQLPVESTKSKFLLKRAHTTWMMTIPRSCIEHWVELIPKRC